MPVAYQCRWCKGPPLPEPPPGRCPACGGRYRHDRVFVSDGEVDGAAARIEPGEAAPLADIVASVGSEEEWRLPTGMEGVDWVLGGGIPLPIALLLASREGSGKSTFLLEMFRHISWRKITTLYIQTEEDERQLGQRYRRLGRLPAKHMLAAHVSDIDAALDLIERHKPRVAAIDSVHGLEGVVGPNDEEYAVGSPQGVAVAAHQIKKFASERGCAIWVVGHVTQDGTIAGSNNMKHMLDGTFYLDRPAKESDPSRTFRSMGKNRYAPSGRRAALELRDDGMHDLGPAKEAS